MNKIVWDIVSKTITNLNDDDFQSFCMEILPCFDPKYEGLERHGATASRNTRKGTPDAIKTDIDSKQIAMQASIDKKYWEKSDIKKSKPYNDIIKCKNTLKNLKEIVLISNQEIPTNNADVKSQIMQKVWEEADYTIDISFYSIATIEGAINKDFLKCFHILKKYMNKANIDYIEKDFSESSFVVKQYICNDWSMISEILQGNLKHFPCKSNTPILYSNEFTAEIIKTALLHANNPLSSEGENFSFIDEISNKHSDINISKTRNEYTGEAEDYITRPLKLKDLDPYYIQKQIVLNGLDINAIGIIEYILHQCGEAYYGDYLNIIQPKFSFLYIQNISEQPQIIKKLDIYSNCDSFQLKPFSSLSGSLQSVPFREMQIEQNQALIIPQGFLFWEEPPYYSMTTRSKQLINMGEHGIEETYTINENSPNASILTPFFVIKSFDYLKNSENRKFEVKNFDVNNYFKIDHCWYCGSCPHFYIKNTSNKWKYFGETLTNVESSFYSYKIIKPIKSLKIIELEEEISYFRKITIKDSTNNLKYNREDVILKQNEFIDIDFNDFVFPITFEVEGYYQELFESKTNSCILEYKKKKAKDYTRVLNKEIQNIPF